MFNPLLLKATKINVLIFTRNNKEIYNLSDLNSIDYDNLDLQGDIKIKVETMNYSLEVKETNNIYYVLK